MKNKPKGKNIKIGLLISRRMPSEDALWVHFIPQGLHTIPHHSTKLFLVIKKGFGRILAEFQVKVYGVL